MRSAISVYDYLAYNKPSETMALIRSYGYSLMNQQPDEQYLAECLKKLVRNEGEDALKEIADMHPDKELILSYTNKNLSATGEQETGTQQPITETKCNCSQNKNCPGCNASQQNNNLFSAAIIVTGMLLSAAIISKL